MNNEIPKLNQPETLKSEENFDKNFEQFFLSNQPFLHEKHETKSELKATYASFNTSIYPLFIKLSQGKESSEQITEELNYLASQVMAQTALALGYDPNQKIELATSDILTINANLGILVKSIQQDLKSEKSFSEIKESINSLFNKNIDEKTSNKQKQEFIQKSTSNSIEDFNSPKSQLILSTMNEEDIITLTNLLLKDPSQNQQKILHLAHNLPTSNLTLISAQVLDKVNQDPTNKAYQDLFQKINSQTSHTEQEFQKEFTKNLAKIDPKFDYGRGWEGFSQNRIFLGVAYVWSMITFLSNLLQAGSLAMGSERKKNAGVILKSLALAAGAGGIMGVTGTAILTGKPPLKVAENYLSKAFDYLTLTKEDVDSMSVQETKTKVPRFLDQSGPYIASIFTDNDIIQALTSTNTLINGDEQLTDKNANEKLNTLYEEIRKKSPEKAEFFKKNYINTSKSNSQKALLIAYFLQKSYLREGVGITTRDSFMSKFKENPDKYPKIEDFKALQNE